MQTKVVDADRILDVVELNGLTIIQPFASNPNLVNDALYSAARSNDDILKWQQ